MWGGRGGWGVRGYMWYIFERYENFSGVIWGTVKEKNRRENTCNIRNFFASYARTKKRDHNEIETRRGWSTLFVLFLFGSRMNVWMEDVVLDVEGNDLI